MPLPEGSATVLTPQGAPTPQDEPAATIPEPDTQPDHPPGTGPETVESGRDIEVHFLPSALPGAEAISIFHTARSTQVQELQDRAAAILAQQVPPRALSHLVLCRGLMGAKDPPAGLSMATAPNGPASTLADFPALVDPGVIAKVHVLAKPLSHTAVPSQAQG